jgi:hypothetical protein
MTEDTLRSIIDGKIAQAIGGGLSGDSVAADRKKAESYYRGEKMGDEKAGRSQVVSRDVAEAIDQMMPAIMKIFCGGGEVVAFTPRGLEDEKQAKQETDYVNWIFREQNDGFQITYDWVKDALMKRLGVVKVWWDEQKYSKREQYEGLTDGEFLALLLDPKMTLVEHTSYPDPDAAGPQGAAA